jgi:hypothetical protein
MQKLKIYVYELDPIFNEKIVQRRPWCAKEAFGTEIYIHKRLLKSRYRTMNPEEANMFFVPVYSACIVYRNFRNFKAYRYIVKKSIESVQRNYPFWNRTRGRDHIWAFVHDHGGCLSWNNQDGIYFKDLRNSIFLSHLGDLSSSCFSTHKDIVIPPMCTDKQIFIYGQGGKSSNVSRTIFAYFRGTIHWTHKKSIRQLGISQGKDPNYSNGIRQKLYQLYKTDPLFSFRQGSSQSYISELEKSLFCLCPRGYASWSRRLFDAIMLGCIPVIIADDIQLPFESRLDYANFSVKIMENEIDRLREILRGISRERIDFMQRNLQIVWKAFSYSTIGDDDNQGDAFDFILQELAEKVDIFPRLPTGPNAFY